MLKHAKTFLVTLLLFALSISLVFYVDNKKIPLPDFLEALLANVEALFAESFESFDSLPVNKQLAENTPLFDYTSSNSLSSNNAIKELGAHAFTCTDKVKAPGAKSIYTWIDNKGIRNVSDRPRVIDASTPIEILTEVRPENISIKFIGSGANSKLQYDITKRVLAANEFYSSVSPRHLITPVALQMSLFLDETDYKAYQRSVAPNLASSQGFYRSSANEAAVLISSHRQGVNTAVHEAMHAMNSHWFGTMARWLNEGIAEYAESAAPHVFENSQWRKFLSAPPISLGRLFHSTNEDWQNPAIRNDLYGTSWAFTAYLMHSKQSTLSQLLLQESENECETISPEDVERIYGKSIDSIQLDFDRWRQQI